MINDYPIFRVKVIVETEYQPSHTHRCNIQSIESLLNFAKEIDAVKAAIDTLREMYYELERDENSYI